MKLETQKKLKNDSGFSLIEMLVAVAVFSTAATIGAGALLSVSDAQQKILSLRVVQDNLGYVFDTMGKEIRTGTNYHCGANINDFNTSPRDCVDYPGGLSFTFISGAGATTTYRINGNTVERILNGDSIPSTFVMTSPDANINSLNFYVIGSPKNDELQPRVTIILKGTAGAKEKIKSFINIQTTISQRLLDS